MQFFLIVTLFVYSVNANEYISSDLEPLTDEIINAINALNTTWKAGKNFDGLSSVQMDHLVFTQYKTSDYVPYIPNEVYLRKLFPVTFDAREAWPNCTSIGKIYDQTKGYPSWIYTAVGTVADQICIKTGARIDVEATVDRIIRSNGSSNGYNSANIDQAFNYWSKKGIFTVEEPSCLPLSQRCQPDEIKLNRYFKVTNEHLHYVNNMMQAIMLNGQISAYMKVYSDFPSYKSGVYMRSSEKSLGIHDVKIIGWGTENGVDYWLAANSWGTEWGDKGFFKILRGKHEFGTIPPLLSTSIAVVDIIQDIPKSYDHNQLFYLAK